MKALLFSLCLFISTALTAQYTMLAHMDVMGVENKTSFCYSDTLVLWGFDYNTIAFRFAGRFMKFDLCSQKDFKGRKERGTLKRVNTYLNSVPWKTFRHFLVKDTNGTKYLIVVSQDDGLNIYITCIYPTPGDPSYYLSFSLTPLCH